MTPENFPWQEYVYRLLEDGNMSVHEKDGHSNSLGLRTGHVSILDLAEREKDLADLRITYIYIYTYLHTYLWS
jgi:hypothetical protein